MGTSQSSKGSPSGVPMVPPWVPDPPSPPPPTPVEAEPEAPQEPGSEPSTESTVPIDLDGSIPTAPAGRFRAANINLAAYARSSDRAAMRRGVGQYFSQGYGGGGGGGGTAVRRFAGTARTADALYAALSGGAAALGIAEEANISAGSSAQEVMDAVTEAVRPVDGTQDTESSRAAIQDALAETLTQFPDADLTNLSEEQKEIAVERYVASDVYRRFSLDVGGTVIKKAPNAVAGASRLKEIREYVRETVSAAFRKIRTAGQRLGAGRVASIVRSALGEAIQVFEGYL